MTLSSRPREIISSGGRRRSHYAGCERPFLVHKQVNSHFASIGYAVMAPEDASSTMTPA
jgi:hypothetical protein